MHIRYKLLLLVLTLVFQNPIEASTGLWLSPEIISTPTGTEADSYDPQIAADCDGNFHAIWVNEDGDGTIDTAFYTAATTSTFGNWSTPTPIPGSTEVDGDNSLPQIAVDCSGNAYAVWVRTDDTKLYSARYTPGSGWGSVQPISESDAFRSRIAVGCNGTVHALWQQGSPRQMYTAKYTAATDMWSTPTVISTGDAIEKNLQITTGCSGNAHAIWLQGTLSEAQTFVSMYTAASDMWSTMAISDTYSLAERTNSQVDIVADCNGNVHAIWTQGTSPYYIYTRMYTPGTEWGSTTTFSVGYSSNGPDPRIATDCSGNAHAVWVANTGITAAMYTATTDMWSTPTVFSAGREVQVAVDCNGNAHAVWRYGVTGYKRIRTAMYTPESGWGDVQEIASFLSGGGVFNPQIAIDRFGNAQVVFQQGASSEIGMRIYSVLFYTGPVYLVPSPGNIRARQELHRFPTQADLINVISWDQVSYINPIVKYKIFCSPNRPTEMQVCCENECCLCYPPFCCTATSCADARLVGEVLGSVPLIFCHHDRCPGQQVTYCIVAVDSMGNESQQGTITVPT